MERIVELIQHPERLDRDTLYELRSMLALYPYQESWRGNTPLVPAWKWA